jgi:hypothetical protein
MGAPPEIIEKHCGVPSFEVDYYNWKAVVVFQSCSTQWRLVSTMGGAVPQGLDYSSVESVMRMMRIKNSCKTFMRVQYIERGYLEKAREKK